MGGGPHIRIKVSPEGGGRWSFIMFAVTKPVLYFHPATKRKEKLYGNVWQKIVLHTLMVFSWLLPFKEI